MDECVSEEVGSPKNSTVSPEILMWKGSES
jgi:hypothetical protein